MDRPAEPTLDTPTQPQPATGTRLPDDVVLRSASAIITLYDPAVGAKLTAYADVAMLRAAALLMAHSPWVVETLNARADAIEAWERIQPHPGTHSRPSPRAIGLGPRHGQGSAQ